MGLGIGLTLLQQRSFTLEDSSVVWGFDMKCHTDCARLKHLFQKLSQGHPPVKDRHHVRLLCLPRPEIGDPKNWLCLTSEAFFGGNSTTLSPGHLMEAVSL